MKRLISFLVIALTFAGGVLNAQTYNCPANTITHVPVDLSANASSSYTVSNQDRNGQCCYAASNDNCVSFDVTLNSEAGLLNFNITAGSVSTGERYYRIDSGSTNTWNGISNCTTKKLKIDSAVCISLASPHLVFCKSGGDKHTFVLTSIPNGTFPSDQSVHSNCPSTFTIGGVSSVSLTSVYPGAVGAYDSYIVSRTTNTLNVTTVLYNPSTTTVALPAGGIVKYRISGYPTNTLVATCKGGAPITHTLTLTNYGAISYSVPSFIGYCTSSPGAVVTPTVTNAISPLSYIWRNSAGSTVSTASAPYVKCCRYRYNSGCIYIRDTRCALQCTNL